MKIDLDAQFHNADDTPAIDGQTHEPITLRGMLIQALLAEAPEAEKVKCYNLYRTIKKAQRALVADAEDIAFLKKRMLMFPVLVVGQAHEMLETAYVESAVDVIAS